YTKKFLQSIEYKEFKTGETLNKDLALLGFKISNQSKGIIPQDEDGLDELVKVTIKDSYDLPREEPTILPVKQQNLPLDVIFITNQDTIAFENKNIPYPFVWNVFMIGHGKYSGSSFEQQRLDQMLLENQEDIHKIEQLTGISFKYTDHDSLIAKLELRM